jgi:hypothetical protein
MISVNEGKVEISGDQFLGIRAEFPNDPDRISHLGTFEVPLRDTPARIGFAICFRPGIDTIEQAAMSEGTNDADRRHSLKSTDLQSHTLSFGVTSQCEQLAFNGLRAWLCKVKGMKQVEDSGASIEHGKS